MTTPSREMRLGAFLRFHRERLSPDIAAGRRRRTPGLRREEIAHLSGMSVTWYTRLEQGREVAASPHALARLAAALQLTRAERAHLFEITGRHDPAAPPLHDDDLPPSLRRSVEAIAAPAYVLDAGWTARAWNPAARHLFAGWLGGAEPNLLAYVFLDPTAQTFIVDWEMRARRLVAEFRVDYEKRLRHQPVIDLAERLRAASPIFADAWNQQTVQDREGGLRTFNHPIDGRLQFDQLTLIPAAEPQFKLVMLLPLLLTRSSRGRGTTEGGGGGE